jgi:outer membrane protein, heavy metal efflux system
MRMIFIGAMLCAGFTVADNVAAVPLHFEEVAQKTLAAHPQFRQFAVVLAASRLREAQAQRQPALELGSTLENALGSGTTAGIKSSELTLSLSSVFERGNKRAARVDLAQSASGLLSVQNRIEALDVLSATGRRFVTLAVAQEQELAADSALRLANSVLDAIRTRVRAAQAPETEQLNAEIAQAEAMLQLANAKRSVQAAQQALALSWNDTAAAPVVAMEMHVMPKPAAAHTLLAQLEALPDISLYGAQTRVAQAELNLARADAVSDWRWSAGVRRLEAADDQAFVVGVSIPLGQAKRQESVLREAEINTQLPDLTAQAIRLKLKALLFAAVQEMNAAIAVADTVRDQQLPQANRVLALTLRGYEMGRYSYRDLALAQAQLQMLELKRLSAAQAYHLARIELERLTGAQLNLLADVES